jgi:hypothetical protein
MEEKEKEELIQHWMDIINTVFWAEDKLSEEWTPKLIEAKKLPQEEREEFANSYVRAIAAEILSKSSSL